jgi:hypothetical protein
MVHGSDRGGIIVYIDYQSVRFFVGIGYATNSPASECVSPLYPNVEGQQHWLADEGVGGPSSDDWRKAWHSVYPVVRIFHKTIR